MAISQYLNAHRRVRGKHLSHKAGVGQDEIGESQRFGKEMPALSYVQEHASQATVFGKQRYMSQPAPNPGSYRPC